MAVTPPRAPATGAFVPCFISREDADPTIEAPECTHAACDPWWAECRWNYLHAVCMRPDGHEGEHGEWESDDEVTLTFVAEAP